ncbi:hypothetical protein ACIP4Y_29500 [Streptomyces sp. NPDC088810]|uniref:hypothetical protein n=1 Tax=Streptomyces sp. NPDC088810 TaxID=3365904 RepID=UPI0038058E72
MTAAGGPAIRAWLAQVWPRTEAALVLAGGDVRVPLAGRPVLGEIFDDAGLADLAWGRGRFRNHLAVADPQGLCALLRRYGAHWL